MAALQVVKILRRMDWLKKLLSQKPVENRNFRFVLITVALYAADQEALSEKQVYAGYVSESLHQKENFPA